MIIKYFYLSSICVALCSTGLPLAHSHPGHHDEEPNTTVNETTWRDLEGKLIEKGSLLISNDLLATIERQDGRLVQLQIQTLDQDSLNYVTKSKSAVDRINSFSSVYAFQKSNTNNKETGTGLSLSLMESVFAPFKPLVNSYGKGDYFFIESNGLPQHRMMVGITAWNQQVPLPHPFTGDNAFRLPLFPKFSANPVSGRENLFKGAIAVAANGIPIFNPIKQDGRTDTYLAGELDEYGGHAGRADDYHYHIAPVHLQKIIGEGKPIAFALDGYPIYGYKEPDGSPVKDLDWLNGHTDKNGNYHYHATSNYPYLNGGFRGQVNLAGGQVAVQPKTRGVRPYTRPLRGAKITGFEGSLDKGYSLKYNHNGVDHVIRYLVKDDSKVDFEFVDPQGELTKETYSPRERGRRNQQSNNLQERQRPERPNDRGQLQREQPEGRGSGNSRTFRIIDANRDGTINAQELSNALESLMDLDSNKDGTISKDELRGEQGRGQMSRTEGRRSSSGGQIVRGIKMPTPLFRTEVPEHIYDIILGKPTKTAVTASVLAYQDLHSRICFGTEPNALGKTLNIGLLEAGIPKEVLIDGLKAGTQYFYKLQYGKSLTNLNESEVFQFHTSRDKGDSFVFTVQADSHLDFGTDPAVYEQTLKNALESKPDFHFALGDAFFPDKRVRYQDALDSYIAQRYYFGLLCHSAPLFFALGNHDGESGYRDNGRTENIAVWSAKTRNKYIPNPAPNAFYSGNTSVHPEIGLLKDYYAWDWGDAQFIVLDPFWYSGRGGRDGMWAKSLGKKQYDWLKETLENSEASYRFIFLHYLVGGLDNQTRGGVNIANLYEWGGENSSGKYEWATKRPGWEKPIHQLLVQHNVSIVFHGHDHLYAKEELDGVIYQEVPQPGHRSGNTRSAGAYGYDQRNVIGSSGHVRVAVTNSEVKVEYIKTRVGGAELTASQRKYVADSYSVKPLNVNP